MSFCSSSIVSLSISRETIICRSLGFLSFSLSLTFCSFVGQVAYELRLELQRLREAVIREAREEEEERKWRERQEGERRWQDMVEEEEEEDEEDEAGREAPASYESKEVF